MYQCSAHWVVSCHLLVSIATSNMTSLSPIFRIMWSSCDQFFPIRPHFPDSSVRVFHPSVNSCFACRVRYHSMGVICHTVTWLSCRPDRILKYSEQSKTEAISQWHGELYILPSCTLLCVVFFVCFYAYLRFFFFILFLPSNFSVARMLHTFFHNIRQ